METNVTLCAGDARVTRKECPAIKSRLLFDEPVKPVKKIFFVVSPSLAFSHCRVRFQAVYRETQTLGHVHSSSLMLRLASHHLTISSRFPVETMTHPFAHGFAAGLLFRLAPHTMLRIVFVAVDRIHA